MAGVYPAPKGNCNARESKALVYARLLPLALPCSVVDGGQALPVCRFILLFPLSILFYISVFYASFSINLSIFSRLPFFPLDISDSDNDNENNE